MLVDTGEYIENDKARAADVAVKFLDPEGKMGLNPQVLQNVFSQPMAIRWDGLYPEAGDLDKFKGICMMSWKSENHLTLKNLLNPVLPIPHSKSNPRSYA